MSGDATEAVMNCDFKILVTGIMNSSIDNSVASFPFPHPCTQGPMALNTISMRPVRLTIPSTFRSKLRRDDRANRASGPEHDGILCRQDSSLWFPFSTSFRVTRSRMLSYRHND